MAIWVLFVSLTFSFSSFVIFVNAVTDPSDVSSLNVLYTSLNLPSQLTGWIPNGGDPCGESWKGITCIGSSVVGIKLSGMELTGTLGYMMNSMTSLIELDLSSNSLGDGTQMPFNLPPNLRRLNLAGNKFNGVIPYSISQMVSLNYLNLNHNQVEGNLNDMFGKLSNLSTMDLSFNSLSGDLPASFSALSNLTNLYLQNNQFTGTIDVLADLPLLDLNVAENHFTGWIPNQLKGIRNLETSGNSWSFGPSPPSPPVTSPQTRRIAPGHKSGSPKNPSTGAGNDATSVDKSSGISTGVITGIIISVLAISAVVAFFLIRQRHRKTYSSKAISKDDHTFKPFHTQSAKGSEPIQLSPVTISEALQETSSTTLKPPPNRQTSFDDENTLNSKKASTASIKGICYSVADLQSATNSFSMNTIVGEGSIGRVFRASFSDGKVLAVKKLNSCFLHNQSTNDFIEMVSNISNMHHPNISELVGYCSEHGQNLLVYDFYKNGSLYDALHHIDEFSKPLEWNMRVKIALGTARALEYLHEVCSPSIIHKNFKSANILLDGELNPRLSDCELASFNPAFGYQALDHSMNSGYIAPEVTMSGLYTLKSDVYSFGVVMLELLTGRKAFDSSRSRSEQCLVQWATPQLHDIDALDKMVDPSLEGLYPAKTLSRFADVIALCVQAEPEFRPPMSEVVQSLVRLLQRAHMSKRTRSSERLDGTRRVNDL